MKSPINNLVAYAHVADVSASVAFYARLGFTVTNSIPNIWAYLKSGKAELMLAKASGTVIADQQAVLFYMYTEAVSQLREELLEQDIKVSAISFPGHMPKGEIRLEDLDGYVILIGQLA